MNPKITEHEMWLALVAAHYENDTRDQYARITDDVSDDDGGGDDDGPEVMAIVEGRDKARAANKGGFVEVFHVEDEDRPAVLTQRQIRKDALAEAERKRLARETEKREKEKVETARTNWVCECGFGWNAPMAFCHCCGSTNIRPPQG